jgi:acetyltransferase-like isoleucine patch superfamily enzyme
LNPISLVAVALLGWFLSGLTFLSLLILTKKLFIGNVSEVGCGTIASPLVRRWFPAAMLIATLDISPFRSMTTGMSFVGPWFYRSMGAKMPNSVLIGGRTLIYDPWFLEVGENVTIGTGAMILGHAGDGPDVKLGRVVIEAGAVVGVNSVIFPDVRVGENARIAAGAVVVRGARVGNDEVWGGIPARKISVRNGVLTARAR